MRIVVAGASGFVGTALTHALHDAGHEVRAMTRRPDDYRGAGRAVFGDVDDPDSLRSALRGCDAACYLVHSLDHRDFVRRDAAAAEAFGAAAARARLARIVYLGGLGDDSTDLSRHLRSRHDTETHLAAAGVPVTTLRAGIVIGHRGASWEIIRNVVEKVPALVIPRWALTRTQPIALADTVRYLVGVLADESRQSHTFEIGGAEVLRYVDLLSRVSALEGRPSIIVPVPVPAIRVAALIASQGLPLLTGVDAHTIRSLLESMRNEVVVHDRSIRQVVAFEPMDYDQMVLAALGDRAKARRAANG